MTHQLTVVSTLQSDAVKEKFEAVMGYEQRKRKTKEEKKMSYEQISESTYFNNIDYWNSVAREYRVYGGLGICDDETGEELYVI